MPEEEETMQYKFLMPLALRQRIEAAAISNRRSVSGEIIFALEKAYPKPVGSDVDRALQSMAVVLNLLAETGDETAIQHGLRYAAQTLDELGIKDRKFWYTSVGGQFVILYTTPEEGSREWTDAEIAAHVVRASPLKALNPLPKRA